MINFNPNECQWNHDDEDNTMIKRVCYKKYVDTAYEQGFEPFDFKWFCNNDFEDEVMMKSLLDKSTFQWYLEEHKKELKTRKSVETTGVRLF